MQSAHTPAEPAEYKLMKVAHVYMSFQSITFRGFEIEGVKQDLPMMQNKSMLEELINREEGDETWASNALFFGEFSEGASYTDWIEIITYPEYEPSSDDKNMIHWFRNQAINQWGSPQNASGNGRPSEQHYRIPFEYVDAQEYYTEERMNKDLLCLANKSKALREVIDINHPFLTTVDAEEDRHHIYMATESAANRLRATGNYPELV